jgi:hypothetical protein
VIRAKVVNIVARSNLNNGGNVMRKGEMKLGMKVVDSEVLDEWGTGTIDEITRGRVFVKFKKSASRTLTIEYLPNSYRFLKKVVRKGE